MRGWVTHAFNDMRLEELPVPKLAPGWAVLRTKVVQRSVTELQLFFGERFNSDEVKKKARDWTTPAFRTRILCRDRRDRLNPAQVRFS